MFLIKNIFKLKMYISLLLLIHCKHFFQEHAVHVSVKNYMIKSLLNWLL